MAISRAQPTPRCAVRQRRWWWRRRSRRPAGDDGGRDGRRWRWRSRRPAGRRYGDGDGRRWRRPAVATAGGGDGRRWRWRSRRPAVAMAVAMAGGGDGGRDGGGGDGGRDARRWRWPAVAMAVATPGRASLRRRCDGDGAVAVAMAVATPGGGDARPGVATAGRRYGRASLPGITLPFFWIVPNVFANPKQACIVTNDTIIKSGLPHRFTRSATQNVDSLCHCCFDASHE
jgi:hypothetical protein